MLRQGLGTTLGKVLLSFPRAGGWLLRDRRDEQSEEAGLAKGRDLGGGRDPGGQDDSRCRFVVKGLPQIMEGRLPILEGRVHVPRVRPRTSSRVLVLYCVHVRG